MTRRLGILVPAPGAFTLDTSTLDGPDLLALDAPAGTQWDPIECDATNITVNRGGGRQGLGVAMGVGNLTASFVDNPNPLTGSPIRPGLPIRYIDTTADEPLFTGKVENTTVTYSKTTKKSYITVTALDSIKPLASTPRYGAAGPEPWQNRFNRLLASSPVPSNPPAAMDYAAEFNELEDVDGGDQLSEWTGTWSPDALDPTYIVNDDTTGQPTSRTYKVEPGRVHRLTIWKWSPDGDDLTQVAMDVDCPHQQPYTGSSSNTVTFRPETDTVTVTLTGAAGISYGISHTTLAASALTAYLCETVHESNLAAHLDIAANSADVGWFVDRHGIVQVTDLAAAQPVAHLADVHDDGDPLHVCYLEVTPTYDTAAAINTTEFTNHDIKTEGDTPIPLAVPAPPTGITDWTPWTLYELTAPGAPEGYVRTRVRLVVNVPTRLSYAAGEGRIISLLWPGIPYQLDSIGHSVYAKEIAFAPENPGDTVNVEAGTLTLSYPGTATSADDQALGPYIRHAAAATYGENAEGLETTVYTGTPMNHMGTGVVNGPTWLARRLLDRYATPAAVPATVTFDAGDHPELAATIDVHDLVTVAYLGVTHTMRVLGIGHTDNPNVESPGKHEYRTTLTLMKAN